MSIVSLALRRPYTFVVAALLIVLCTPFVLRNMASDVFPRIDIPVVAILWQYNGMSAKEIADRITTPTERGLTQSVTDIEHTESISLAGLSVVKVFFQPGTDIRSALTQVLSNTTTVQRSLPQGTQPPQVYQYSATDLPILQLGMSSLTLPDTQIGDLATNTVRSRLVTIPGVSLNNPYGVKNRQVSVDLDGAALLARGLAPADVVEAIGAQNLILPTGTVKWGGNDYPIALNGAIGDISAIGDIPIRTVHGSTTFLRDVAQVRDGSAPQTNIVRQNGDRGVLLTILKNASVSTAKVVEDIKAALPKILEQLPEGIKLEPMFDQSLFVDAAIGNVVHEGLIAAALTSALILLFLGNWRSTCIVAISIPLSICASLIVLYFIGQTLNLMTLGGLALAVGILVDDATVEIENIERQMKLGKSPHQAILDGAEEIATPAFVSTLCICIVFVPLFFLTGITRYLFVPLAQAVIFAMIASYILSRTLVPTLVMFMMRSSHEPRAHGSFQRIHRSFEQGFENFRSHYRVILGAALRRRGRFAWGFITFCVLSFGLYPLLGQDFFPSVDAGQLRLHVRGPQGIRLEEMPPRIDEIDAAIRELIPQEELATILDIIGGPYSPRNTVFGNAGSVDPSDAEIMIALSEGHRGSERYMNLLRKELPRRFPEFEFFFQPADQVSQSLNFGTPAPIDIQISGSRTAENHALAVEINRALHAIPGVVDAHIHQRANRPALSLEMNRAQLQQFGLSARDVAQSLLISLSGSGQTSPSYWLNPANGATYNVGVRTREVELDSLDALLRTPITGNAAHPQLLGNLVNLTRTTQPSVVSHYDIDPVIDIYASVAQRDLGSATREIERVVDEFRPRLSRGSDIAVRGQQQAMRASYRALILGVLVAVVLAYFLIVVNFQSWLDPLVIISSLPAALAGIAWLLFLSGTTLSVPALTGAIMTIGVATANSILVVSFARTRLQAGVTPVQAALEAGATRLRPVLMTALAMMTGMLPMALGIGAGAEQNAPLGRAVIGGLLFATVSTLLFVPVMFATVHRFLEERSRISARSSALPEPAT
jgi:CzcA family heavy metal efflux pump